MSHKKRFKPKKYVPSYDEKKLQQVPCRVCGELVEVFIHPLDNGNLKVYCYPHRQIAKITPYREKEDDSNGPLMWFASQMLINHGAGPVSVFYPGDDGFTERADAVELPKKKQKKERPFYSPFEGLAKKLNQ